MDTKVDLHRFDEQVNDLKKMLADNPPAPGGVLFYGSSTMGNWRANDWCYKHMEGIPLTNTGFGGSTAEDALYHYRELVFPVKPKLIVYYEGANDLFNAYDIDDILETTHRVFEWCRQDFPGVKFLIMPIKLCPCMKDIREDALTCNEKFAEYAEKYDDTWMLNLDKFLYNEDGSYRTDIYVEDMLHHHEKGYEELATFVRPEVEKLFYT